MGGRGRAFYVLRFLRTRSWDLVVLENEKVLLFFRTGLGKVEYMRGGVVHFVGLANVGFSSHVNWNLSLRSDCSLWTFYFIYLSFQGCALMIGWFGSYGAGLAQCAFFFFFCVCVVWPAQRNVMENGEE